MKPEEELLNKFGRETGQKVPDDYFQDLEKAIMTQLPPYIKAPQLLQLSRWQRVKPYVYLAAMFCGIWVMMKVFHTATQPISMSLDNPPSALVELVDNGYEYEPYFNYYSTEYDPEEEDLIMSYDNIEDFERDFGYTLKPEYSTLPDPKSNSKNG